jgi:hypothetical protein
MWDQRIHHIHPVDRPRRRRRPAPPCPRPEPLASSCCGSSPGEPPGDVGGAEMQQPQVAACPSRPAILAAAGPSSPPGRCQSHHCCLWSRQAPPSLPNPRPRKSAAATTSHELCPATLWAATAGGGAHEGERLWEGTSARRCGHRMWMEEG